MDPPIRPLVASLGDLPDPRHPQGRRHPLAAMLAFMGGALRGGYRRDSALADWGRGYGQTLIRAWGFTHDQTPWAATRSPVLRPGDAPRVEAPLGAGAERLRPALPPVPGEPEARAMEGKTLRGSRQQGAPAPPLLSGRSHRWGLPLGPQAGADKTHALPVLEDVRRALVVEGRLLPVDAQLTQRAIAARLVPGGGDEVRRVKGHPPQLPHDMPLVVPEAHASAATVTTAERGDSGHGRLEPRRLTASSALVGYRAGPGLAQVFPRERRVTLKTPGAPRPEVVQGVTSLSLEQAAPERLLGLGRPHGQSEHPGPGVRDGTCDADRSQGRGGRIPQVRAAFRHTVIGFMHWTGETNMAAACRRFAAQPWSAFALLGIRPDN